MDLPQCTTIGSNAFAHNKKLKKIRLPHGERINASAFVGCTSLSKVEIGKDITKKYTAYIGANAFSGAVNLGNLTLYHPYVVPLSAVSAFTSTLMSTSKSGVFGSIYVPASLVATY